MIKLVYKGVCMALKRGIVKLDEYTNDWEKEYLKEEKLLKSLLKDKIIEIHHIFQD